MTAAGEAGSSEARRIAVLAARWLVPVAILAAFVISGHLVDALSTLGEVSPGWSILLVAVGVALPLSHAYRWCYLLRRTGAEVPPAGSARITSLSSLLNYAAPGFLGAPAKAIFARDRYKVPISRSLPTLAVEQLLDALLLLVAGSVAAVIAGPVLLEVFDDQNALIEGLAALGMLIVLGIAGAGAWLVGRRWFPGFSESLRTATRELIQSREHRRPILALTGARWILDMGAVSVASIAVGLRLGVLDILLLANLALLAGLVAPVPGGLGVREAVMASIASVLGISVPAILALSILHRAGLALGLPIVLAGARIAEWRPR